MPTATIYVNGSANIILIDSRIGSKHYAGLIPNSQLMQLDYGDVAFMGYDGITIGVEIKKILDAVNCMFSGRLADHQIPGMKESYTISYLIIEGLWQSDPASGVLQYYKGELGKWGKWVDASHGRQRLMYSSFESWLSTMELHGGLRIRNTSSPQSTANLLISLYNWWQRGDHKSFHILDEGFGDGAELSRPGMLRRMIALLPRIGWSRSGVLVRRFKSVRDMCEAGPERWLIPNEIAMPTAEKIVSALQGNDQ